MSSLQILYTQIRNEIKSYFAKHRTLWAVVLCAFCLAFTFPSSLLATSGYMSSMDNMFEDMLYQHRNVDDSPVVVIRVDTIDPEYDILTDIGRTGSLVQLLNSFEEKPAVIGLNFRLDFDSYGEDYNHFLDVLEEGNVVLGKTLSVSNFDRIQLGGAIDDKLIMRDNNVYPSLIKSLCREGFTNLFADSDGVVRHYVFDSSLASTSSMDSFANQCYLEYCEYLGITPNTARINDNGLGMVHYSKPAGAYAEYDLTDILMGKYDESDFAGKIVIIGYYDSYLEQEYTTAADHSKLVGNSEVQANAIYNLIKGDNLLEVPIHVQLLVLTFAEALALFVVIVYKFYIALIAGVGLIAGDIFLCMFLWQYVNRAFHPLYVIVSVGCVVLGGLLVNIQRIKFNQLEVNDVLNRYMDSNVRSRILQKQVTNGIDVGVRRNVAVMFADIRNFTAISEDLEPEEVVNMLNSYFTVADKCIHDYGGTLDKFVGDGVMAFWDDEESADDAAFKACQAALAITKGIMEVDDEQYEKHGREISFGIGIAYGQAVLGDIGSKTRRDFTAIGDAANLASRLEAVAPRGTIYISESVMSCVNGRVEAEKLPVPIRVKGKAEPIDVFILNNIPSPNEASAQSLELAPAKQERYSLTILGCRGSYHVSGKRFVEFGGQTTCSVIKTGTHAVVIDCGTGLYEARQLLSDCTKIDVLLSHVHYDHCLGLLDWSIFPKTAELNFYGNFRGWLGLRTINELFSAPFWPVDPVSGKQNQIPDWGKTLYLGDGFSVRFYPAPHPNGAILMCIKAGDKRLCIMVDCERSDGLPFEIVQGCDILVYDGMYTDAEYESKQGWGHSTWQEGCRLAAKAQVKQLVITHHNPAGTDSMLLESEGFAQNIFPDTVFARSGMVIKF